VQQRLTSQGVRDLNGPELDGASYNGRAEGHRHNPGSPVLAHDELRVVTREHANGTFYQTEKEIRVYRCLFCNAELYTSES
jgi:hypothetical protein